MKYKVLYRKYRPQNFDEIIGQDYIIKTLKNSIINENISHAYIFSGPRGTGKTTTAKVFAKAINCLNPQNGTPCEKCEFCLNFQENPDIIEIDAASNNGIDEIRNLIDNIKLTPSNGKYKVYIIDEVHMLTVSAFNALLLTLEEPPAHAVFILATTNVENVPITILSRCQRFDFKKISLDDLVTRLREVCTLENIDIDDDALNEIAYLAEGGMRDALSLLDQLAKNKEKITLEFIEENIKSVSIQSIKKLIDSIEENDTEKCLEIINDYRNRAVDYKTLAKKLIDVLSKIAQSIKQSGHYKRLSFNDYKDLIIELADSISKININVDSYTILEMILLNYIDVNAISDFANANFMEKNNDNQFKNVSEKNAQENAFTNTNINENNIETPSSFDERLIKIRINNCFYGAKKSYLDEAKNEFNHCLQSINIDGEIKLLLEDSMVVAASNEYRIYTVKNEHIMAKANKSLVKIEKLYEQELNKKYKLIFITNEMWQKEKEEYIINLKNKYEYHFIEENQVETVDDVKPKLNDVFNLDKVEII